MSTKISNLPPYVGAPQPTGFIAISIGGITYKIDPSQVGVPVTQQKSDWNATSGVTQILNKPSIPQRTSELVNDGQDTNNPFISFNNIQQYKSANFTAENNIFYVVGNTGTVVTDPTTPVIGKGFVVFVLRGTSVVGGVTWIDLSLVYRFYTSSGWVSKDMSNQQDIITINNAIALKQDALGYTPLNRAGDVISGDIGNTGVGFFRVPNGTTAQRPASPVDGMIRFNTTTQRNEFYSNGVWRNHARLYGDAFTGNITATNLSGTNTGDETSATIISKIGTPLKTVIKDATAYSALTGTLTETLMATYFIPANTFGANDNLRIPTFLAEKTGVSGTVTMRVKIGSTNVFGSATNLATYTTGVTEIWCIMQRSGATLRGGNIRCLQATLPRQTDIVATSGLISVVPFNPAVDNWVFTSLQLSVITDSVFQSNFLMTN